MRTSLFEELKYEVKNWWVSLISGILLVGLGFLMIFYPMAGYAAIAIIFSITMLISGVLEVFFSVSNKNVISDWGWFLAFGILDIILGLVLLFIPGLKEAILPFILAFWLMFRGISNIGYSIDLNRYGSKNWGWYLTIGILSILCSVGVIFFPMAGAVSVVWIISFVFLFLGLSRIMLAFDLRKLHSECQQLKKRLEEHERH